MCALTPLSIQRYSMYVYITRRCTKFLFSRQILNFQQNSELLRLHVPLLSFQKLHLLYCNYFKIFNLIEACEIEAVLFIFHNWVHSAEYYIRIETDPESTLIYEKTI